MTLAPSPVNRSHTPSRRGESPPTLPPPLPPRVPTNTPHQPTAVPSNPSTHFNNAPCTTSPTPATPYSPVLTTTSPPSSLTQGRLAHRGASLTPTPPPRRSSVKSSPLRHAVASPQRLPVKETPLHTHPLPIDAPSRHQGNNHPLHHLQQRPRHLRLENTLPTLAKGTPKYSPSLAPTHDHCFPLTLLPATATPDTFPPAPLQGTKNNTPHHYFTTPT